MAPPYGLRLLACIYALALYLPCATSALVNITVDDTNADPLTGARFSYSPDGRWNAGNDCGVCLAKLDQSQTFDATWHDATSNPTLPANQVQTASFQFTGEHVRLVCWLNIHL